MNFSSEKKVKEWAQENVGKHLIVDQVIITEKEETQKPKKFRRGIGTY